MLQTFLSHRKGGLVNRFGGKEHWNFYDWSTYAEDTLGENQEETSDLFINCLFVLALENVKYIAEKLGETFAYEKEIRETRKRRKKRFSLRKTARLRRNGAKKSIPYSATRSRFCRG